MTGVAFRPGSRDLASVSADRCLKLWAPEERAHVDTLFGHQADVAGVDFFPSGREAAVTAGRDATAQLYKIPEATRLVFRAPPLSGALECVRAVSDGYFVTGAADGALALWSVGRKRPVAVVHCAHGTGVHAPAAAPHAPADVLAAIAALGPDGCVAAVRRPGALARAADDEDGGEGAGGAAASRETLAAIAAATGMPADGLSAGYCSGVTALAVQPNSDVVASGSGDGFVRLWRLVMRERAGGRGGGAAAAGTPLAGAHFTGLEPLAAAPLRGVVNALAFTPDGAALVAAVGTEHRLGRWWRYDAARVRNGVAVVRLPALPPLGGGVGAGAGAGGRGGGDGGATARS